MDINIEYFSVFVNDSQIVSDGNDDDHDCDDDDDDFDWPKISSDMSVNLLLHSCYIFLSSWRY